MKYADAPKFKQCEKCKTLRPPTELEVGVDVCRNQILCQCLRVGVQAVGRGTDPLPTGSTPRDWDKLPDPPRADGAPFEILYPIHSFKVTNSYTNGHNKNGHGEIA